jgi:hypothetical protein
MSQGIGGTATWPADIIHVNEDGWVLINRGRAHGVLPGLRLLVVGSGIRELRDLFPAAARVVAGDATSQPPAPALRTRRTYEQLDVVYSEDACAVAVATRTPPERRPEFYRGLEGELLVWVPLPAGFTWPQPGADEHDLPPDAVANGDTGDRQEESWDEDDTADTAGEDEVDTPPELAEQDDERWEEALPLNGVNVGDRVVPAVPVAMTAAPAATAASAPAAGAPSAEPRENPFESGRDYEWMKPQS